MEKKSQVDPLDIVGSCIGENSETHLKSAKVVSLEKRRTSVDLSARLTNELDWLVRQTGSKNRADVIRMSLYLYWTLSSMETKGIAIIIRDKEGSNALFVPSLTAINGLLRHPASDKKLRLTFELPAKSLRELDELKTNNGERKKADVIRQAIHLNWVLLSEIQKERTVVVREPSGQEYDLFVLNSEEDQVHEPCNLIHMAL